MNYSNYDDNRSSITYKSRSNNYPSLNKSNITLWKSKYNTPSSANEDKKIEGEYIDNLKKQIYFMEMELKLMKEREREIEKSGGISNFSF